MCQSGVGLSSAGSHHRVGAQLPMLIFKIAMSYPQRIPPGFVLTKYKAPFNDLETYVARAEFASTC